MKHTLLLLLLNFLFSPFLFAQQKPTYTISGLLYDIDLNEPVMQGSIRVLNPSDSTLVTGSISDLNGRFKVASIKGGDYITHISFIGMNDVYRNISLKGEKSTLDMGRVEMSASSILMNEVVVTEKIAEVKMLNDTIEYNAASYKTQVGAVMEDLLKKMPGVEVDTEGKITVNGKEVKKILVDGKEFFFDDPTVASKNIPVEMIEKLQVLDRKSDMARMTGFNDDEEETVINVTVKAEKKRGWFGNVLGGGGLDMVGPNNDNDARYEGNFMVNRFYGNNQFSLLGGVNNTNNMGFNDLSSTMFQGMSGGNRRGGGWRGPGNGITKSHNLGFNFSSELNKQLTFGGDASYSGADTYLERTSRKQNFISDTTTIEQKINRSNSLSDNFVTNLRLEWKPDTMTTLIFRPRFSYSQSNYNERGSLETLTEWQDSINSGWSSEESEGKGSNISANLDFSRKLNSEGRVLSVGLRGSYNDSDDNGLNRSDINYMEDGIRVDSVRLNQQLNFGNNGYNYRAFVSWVEPLGNRNYMQFSYRIFKSYSEVLRYTYDRIAVDETDYHGLLLDTLNSRSSRNNALRQRAGVAFKAERDKYNYTLGINLDPSTSQTETFVDGIEIDSLDKTRKVINVSPQVQFRYNFNKRTNLRLDMEGRTNQPSMAQLQPVVDVSDPLNLLKGNPDLKPSYRQDLRGQFQFFVPETQFSLSSYLNGNLVMNDIVSTSRYNAATGVRTSSYENVNGNWNGSLAVIINTPFKDRRFSVSSFTRGYYTRRNGIVNSQENQSNTSGLMEGGRFNYRSELFDAGINGRVFFKNTQNSLPGQRNQQTFDYNAGATGTLYLPLKFNLDSDVNFDTNSGYSDGYKSNSWLWNASISKQFMKGNQATVRLKVFDILNQRTSIRRSETAESITDTEYNTIGRYFMVYFVYRFNTFGEGKIPGQEEGRGR